MGMSEGTWVVRAPSPLLCTTAAAVLSLDLVLAHLDRKSVV